MKKAVWKFPLEATDQQKVMMPAGAVPLHVDLQGGSTWDGGTLCLWAEVDVDATPVERHVYVMGTGHTFYPAAGERYVGTVQDGILVWHVYIAVTGSGGR